MSQFAWLGELGQYWRNPWIAGLWVSALIAAIILSVLPGSWISLTRHGLSPEIGDVLEPSLHFLGYAVLVGFVSLALNSITKLLYVYVAALLISGSMEIVQLLVPERGASIEDLSMNVLGASAGFLFGVARLRWGSRVPVDPDGR
jgi:VanZ family protein